MINRLAGEVCKLLHDRTFFIETQLAGQLTVGFTIIPLAYALYDWIPSGPLSGGGFFFHLDLPSWIYALVLLPFTITMAVSWKIKERCLQVLKMSAKVPPIQPSASRPAGWTIFIFNPPRLALPRRHETAETSVVYRGVRMLFQRPPRYRHRNPAARMTT